MAFLHYYLLCYVCRYHVSGTSANSVHDLPDYFHIYPNLATQLPVFKADSLDRCGNFVYKISLLGHLMALGPQEASHF